MQHYILTLTDGSQVTETKHRGTYENLTDAQLRGIGVVAVDRWSQAIEDYVEVRRIP